MSTDKTDRNGALHDGKTGQFKSKSAAELKNELVIVIKDRKPVIVNPSTKFEDKELARIPFDYFGTEKSERNKNNNTFQYPPQEAFGFARLDTNHHQKHAEEMGFKDISMYEKSAVEYWKNGEGNIYVSRVRERIYKYSFKSHRMLAITSDGIIHTFMLRDPKEFQRKMIQEDLILYV